MTDVLIRRRQDTDTEGRRPRDGGSKDWSDTANRQGKPRAASNHQNLEGRHAADFHLELLEENRLAETLILDSGLWNCGRTNFCCFSAPSLWEVVIAALGS